MPKTIDITKSQQGGGGASTALLRNNMPLL